MEDVRSDKNYVTTSHDEGLNKKLLHATFNKQAQKNTNNIAAKQSNLDYSNKLIQLINILKNINLTSPLAKLNETTISDNNGGRIQL
jgi:hypothetical protein